MWWWSSNPAKLGLTKLTAARELLTSPDADYKHLYTDVPNIKGYADISRWRIPVELGDFGVEFKGLDGNCVKLALKHHSVALSRSGRDENMFHLRRVPLNPLAVLATMVATQKIPWPLDTGGGTIVHG